MVDILEVFCQLAGVNVWMGGFSSGFGDGSLFAFWSDVLVVVGLLSGVVIVVVLVLLADCIGDASSLNKCVFSDSCLFSEAQQAPMLFTKLT